MGLDKLIKREIGITIAVVLLVTTIFLMFSYSVFTVEVTGEQNTIKFGDIALRFCSNQSDQEGCDSTATNMGNIIGTKTENGTTKHVPIYPQEDPSTAEEWASLTPYTFELKNTGNLPLRISIHLNRDNTANFTINETINNETITTAYNSPVDDDQIRIAIGEQGATPTLKNFAETATIENGENKNDYVIASNIILEAGESKIFDFYAWLRSDAANASQGKYFVTQITTRGEFIPETTETLPNQG